jgi:hypothetical protein
MLTLILCSGKIVLAQTDYPLDSTDYILVKKHTSAMLTNQISDLFQVAVKSGVVGSENGVYSFKSSLYGIGVLFDSTLLIDYNFRRLKWARNISVDISTSLGDDNKFKYINPSAKFSLINKRDPKDFGNASSRIQKNLYDANLKLINTGRDLANLLLQEIKSVTDSAEKEKLMIAIMKGSTIDTKNMSRDEIINQLKTLKSYIKDKKKADEALKNIPTEAEIVSKAYDALVTEISKGLLVTLETGGNYDHVSQWTNANAKLECLKGTGWSNDKDKPWDVDFWVKGDASADTTKLTSNLDRQILSSYLGLNKVLISKKVRNQKGVASASVLEILGSAGVDYIANGKYDKEDDLTFNFDFVVSVRIADNVYLPLEIKYDPKNGNVFGFIKLKWDLPNSR